MHKTKPGDKYGHLTAIEWRRDKSGNSAWLCDCFCGKKKLIRTGRLHSGEAKSCGCFKYQLKNESYYRNHPEVVERSLLRIEARAKRKT